MQGPKENGDADHVFFLNCRATGAVTVDGVSAGTRSWGARHTSFGRPACNGKFLSSKTQKLSAYWTNAMLRTRTTV